MNDLKTLFQDIKNIFKEEGVDTTDTKEVLEATIKAEETKEVVDETTETTKEEMAETVKEKFEDIVLADGSVAVAEPDVSLGAAVVVSVDDAMVEAPNGDHELADGRIITTEGGVITAIEEAEAEAEEDLGSDKEEEEMEVEKPLNEAQEREAKKIIESIVTERVFSMEATLSVENEELKSKITRLETAFKSLLDLTEKLVEKPTTETAKKKRSGFAKLKKEKRIL